MTATQPSEGEGRVPSPAMSQNLKNIPARARARAERYWIAQGHLYCQHGRILYGTKCVACEREIDAVFAGGAVRLGRDGLG